MDLNVHDPKRKKLKTYNTEIAEITYNNEILLWADHNPSNFLKAVFHKFYLVHS